MRVRPYTPLLIAALAWVCCSRICAQASGSKSVFITRAHQLLQSGGVDLRLESAYDRVVTAASAGELQSIPAQQLCTLASQAATDSTLLQEAHHAAYIMDQLRCQDAAASAKAAVLALKELQHPTHVEAAYQSISILSRLHKSKSLPEPVRADQIESVLKYFQELGDSSGAFKATKNNSKRSILATGLVYRALAEARSLDVILSSEAETAVEEIRASLAQVLQGGKGGQATLALPGDEDKLQAAAQLVIGAAAIYDDSVASVTGSQLSGAAQLFSQAQNVQSLAEAALVGPALMALTESALPQPLYATSSAPRIALSSKDALVMTVRNSWGEAVSGGKVTVAAVPQGGKAQASSQTLQAGSAAGEYPYTGSSKLKPGSYLLKVDIQDAAGNPAGQSELSLTVSAELQQASLTLAFSEGELEEALNETLSYPQTLSSTTAMLDPSQTLKASLVVEGDAPQQRMLRLVSRSSKASAYFNLKASRVKESTYTVTITSSSLEKQIGNQAGQYDVEVLIGDRAMGTPVRWHVAAVTVSHQVSDDAQAALKPSAAEAVQAQFKVKPEIVHLHRAPGKRPPQAVSLLFTILALLPLLLLFHMLQLAGANVKAFPSGGPSLIAAVAFHGGLASVLGLYTLFWLKLNLIQTLPVLLFLGLFTAVAGYNALSRQAEARLKHQ